MFTLVLAWINARYKSNYELLFIGTFLIDIILINAVHAYLTH